MDKLKKRLIDSFLYRIKKLYSLFDPSVLYSKESFSQEGEDLFLEELFQGQSKGFYIDVGCFHPWRFSNTAKLYKKGWKGVVIDPNPDVIKLFEKQRKNDLSCETGISNTVGRLEYYQFSEAAENTFNKRLADELVEKYSAYEVKEVPVVTLKSLLNQVLQEGQSIDLMDVDAEGYDYEVLVSNDWELYRPKYLLVEDFVEAELFSLKSSKVVKFLEKQNYSLVNKIGRSLVFKDSRLTGK